MLGDTTKETRIICYHIYVYSRDKNKFETKFGEVQRSVIYKKIF